MSPIIYGGGTHELHAEQIKLNAYRLGCLFFANKEIARRSDLSIPFNNATEQLKARPGGAAHNHTCLVDKNHHTLSVCKRPLLAKS